MRPRYSLLLAATAIVTLLGAPRADAGTAGHAPVPANRTTTAAPFEMLQLGSTGDRVRQVQTRLGGLGYGVVADGAFGPKTRRAVISFQTSKRLRPDGKVGSVTWKALGLDPSDPPTTTTTLPTGIPAGSYHHPSPNVERWHAAALAAGWPDSLWKRLSCVMYRESGGLPNLGTLSGAHGLLAIIWSSRYTWMDATSAQLYDGPTNLRIGYKMFVIVGSWSPWRSTVKPC